MNQGTKQRIVGTVVLLALALIFLPIIFDGEGSYQDNLASRIPDPPIISILPEPQQTRPVIIADTDAINLDAQPNLDAQTTAEETETSAVQAGTAGPDELAATDIDSNDDESTVEVSDSEPVFTREIPQLASNGLPEGWSVRLGSFSDASNATKLLEDLLAAEYKAYSRVVEREQGDLTAIFVGPWLDRRRADEYQQRLQEEFKLAGLVVPYEIVKL